MVQRLKITHFYTIPCVLQKLKNNGDEHVKKYDLTSLKTIAVGMLKHTKPQAITELCHLVLHASDLHPELIFT